MNPTEAKFREDLEAVTSQLELGVRSGRYSWADLERKVKERTSAAAGKTDQYVHDHTWSMLGVAAGLGIVLGLLMFRR